MPSLGVLITYHNEKDLLKKCLESLLLQRFPPEEILVYDDASEAPARDYILPEWPVRVIRGEKNLGPSYGRNALLAASQSDYIHFHDSDDWFHPSWCRRVRELLEPGDLDAVFTEVASYIDGKLHRPKVLELERLVRGEDLVGFCLTHAMLVPAGTYRRSLIHSLGGYRTALWQSEDFDFHVRLAAKGIRYGLIDEALVHIRIRPESRSQNQNEVWVYRLRGLRLLISELDAKYQPAIAEAAVGIGSKLFQIGARTEAHEAFQLAQEVGPPRFEQQAAFYRYIAKCFGPETAEWMGLIYRRMLPTPLRQWVRKG